MLRTLRWGLGAVLVTATWSTSGALAQGAIDPRVTIRAADLERQGERHLAVDLLGRYLAVSQADGRAWLLLGRYYMQDARDWHRGHAGEPDGELLLDFATTAFDQAARLSIDSAMLFRAAAEMDRALLRIEARGWAATRLAWRTTGAPPLPPTVEELGRNLTGSCPAGGILLTSGDLQTVAAWYAVLVVRQADDVVPIRPDLYVTDTRYRGRMAQLLGVDSTLSVRDALTRVGESRPLCIAPGTDPAVVPDLIWRPSRLVRVSRGAAPAERPVTLTAMLEAQRGKRALWVREVRDVYLAAARHNPLLCVPLAVVFADGPPADCRP